MSAHPQPLEQLGLFDDIGWNARVDAWLVEHLSGSATVSANTLFLAEQDDRRLGNRNGRKLSACWGRWVNIGWLERDYTTPPLKPENMHNNGRRVNVYVAGPSLPTLAELRGA